MAGPTALTQEKMTNEDCVSDTCPCWFFCFQTPSAKLVSLALSRVFGISFAIKSTTIIIVKYIENLSEHKALVIHSKETLTCELDGLALLRALIPAQKRQNVGSISLVRITWLITEILGYVPHSGAEKTQCFRTELTATSKTNTLEPRPVLWQSVKPQPAAPTSGMDTSSGLECSTSDSGPSKCSWTTEE